MIKTTRLFALRGRNSRLSACTFGAYQDLRAAFHKLNQGMTAVNSLVTDWLINLTWHNIISRHEKNGWSRATI